MSKLKELGYSKKIPTIWILEGLVYYIKKSVIFKMLQEIANITSKSSKIFVDVCIPIFAEVKVSPFSRYFLWGIEKKKISSFFGKAGWEVSSNYADEHDYGRDVGQKGMIYVQGHPIQ
jgi:O-methyltransferase involved in polyketide biosynthesis